MLIAGLTETPVMIEFISAFGQVAQMVEQWTENPRAEGSSPPLTTNIENGQTRRRLPVFYFLAGIFHMVLSSNPPRVAYY